MVQKKTILILILVCTMTASASAVAAQAQGTYGMFHSVNVVAYHRPVFTDSAGSTITTVTLDSEAAEALVGYLKIVFNESLESISYKISWTNLCKEINPSSYTSSNCMTYRMKIVSSSGIEVPVTPTANQFGAGHVQFDGLGLYANFGQPETTRQICSMYCVPVGESIAGEYTGQVTVEEIVQ